MTLRNELSDRAPVRELARAKINLTLEILGRRPDGYHELASLVAFAQAADLLELRPASVWRLDCTGPKAGAIMGENLVARAKTAVTTAWPGVASAAVTLTKTLPVAAGIGGGSADAAAFLRGIRRLNAAVHGPPDWHGLARQLGADVPICLADRASYMTGLGDGIEPVELEFCLPAVLANPAVPLATASVFAELSAPPLPNDWTPGKPSKLTDIESLLSFVAESRNDLEAPAMRLAPVVGHVLALLRAQRGCHLARLSGSGPTCFGLFGSAAQASQAALEIAAAQPDWWVTATALS